MLCLTASFSMAHAQESVLGRGDAVVTGFSGIKPSNAPLKPGTNPLDEFFIDLNGPSAQILSLAVPGGAPSGQLISAPAKLQLKASQIGQVFGAALDDGQGGKVPSIYLGATSAYGLNIVTPDADGDGWPERVKSGQQGADWMAGQFGTDLTGGPGSIYKVDGQTGAVSLFATLPDNSGPGVGDIVFDKATRQFFASDLDRGLIYRLGDSGQVIDSFDHGLDGRPAKGLATVPDNGKQAEIGNPAFSSENPESWGTTQEERRVHGLAVQDGRLYYAVDGQVWSIGISAEGFDKDARWELTAEGLPGEGPITDMLFDKQGRLYIAQRGHQRGSYDYSLFAEPEKSAVARYRREEPDNPATESVWVAEPESYAIGLPSEHHHAEGGIALGYSHDESGALRYGACGDMLWSTGHRLRQSAIAEGGEGEGEADVHGLQGNAVSLVRPQNVPPQQSYFADYDSFFGDAAKAGHTGDVEIWQPCEGAPGFASAQPFGQFPPGIFPPGDIPPDFPPEYPPEYEFETNLKLKKRATPKTCSPFFGGWLCQYTVRVTNTGPDNYFGPILVRDWLPAAPAGAWMGFAPTPPWACWSVGASDNRCVRFGVFLAPGWSVDLTAYALVPKAYDKCHLTNAARIEWAPPGSIWNSDPTDDIDFASANIPAQHCKPGKETDLKIYKEAVTDCFEHNGGIRCGYKVRVENQGPGAYSGDIVVDDIIPNNTTALFSLPAGWNNACPLAGNTHRCTYPNANLPNVTDSVSFIVRIDLTTQRAKELGCKVLNQAEIIEAPSPSPQNTDPTNDEASAIANVPAHICEDKPPLSNLKIVKTAPPNGACLLVNGDWCRGFTITVTNTGPNQFNGTIKITDILPAGVTVNNIGGAGWTCVGTTCETNNAVTLDKNPADNVSLGISVEGSAATAKALNCKLTNNARIDDPLGAPTNIHAADDKDQITVDLHPKFCERPESNLKVEKKANPKLCEKQGGGWWCTYDIVVTNTGPGVYNHVIELEEALPAEPLDATWNAPWTCAGTGGAGAMCKHPIVEIPVNGKVTLKLRVKFAEDVVKEKHCRLPNVVKIHRPFPGSPINNNPGDDIAGDTALVPEDICKQPPTDLELIKWGAQALGCNAQNGQWRCPWIVDVKNVGNADYNGKVVVKDWLPAAASGATMQEQGGVWDCVGNAPSVTCTHPATLIKPGQKVFLQMYVFIDPSKYDGCSLTNTAQILQAPGGSVQNTNAGNDQQSSVLNFQPLLANGKTYCYSPEPSTPCPPGFRWGGERCERIGITTLPPVRVCPTGSVGRYPDCNPGDDDDPDCRPGTVGEYPNCRPVVDPKCPSGSVGTYPNCRPDDPKCPPGTVGNYPHCRDKPDSSTPECTDGRVRRGSVCVCPGSLVWNGDQCVRRKCPEGMRGTFPNCTKVIVDPPKCKTGTVGRWPNCEKIVKICPAGTVGKYPNCRKIPTHCPSNMTGKPPRCHPIVKVCPSGMVGRLPNCKRKPMKLQQPQRFQKFQKPSFKPNFGQGLRGRPSNLRLR